MAHMDHICYSAVKDKNGNVMDIKSYASCMTDSALEEEINRTAHLRNMQNTKLEILQEQKAERVRIKEREARQAKQAEIDKFYTEQKDLPGTEWVFLTIATCFDIREGMFKKGEITLFDNDLLFGSYKCVLATTAKLTVLNLLKNGVRVWYSIQDPKHFKIFLRK